MEGIPDREICSGRCWDVWSRNPQSQGSGGLIPANTSAVEQRVKCIPAWEGVAVTEGFGKSC